MNTLIAIRQLLLANAGVSALVGERVYSISWPRDWKSKLPFILLRRVGAADDPDINTIESPMVDIRCYGATQDGANQVAAALKAMDGVIENEATADYVIHSFRKTAGPIDMPEETDESEQVDCVFTTYAAEITAIL